MNTLTLRLRRFARVAAATVSLVVLALSISLAEGWGNIGGPKSAAVTVTTAHVVYLDGSELLPDGTYISDNVTYSVPAAFYDASGTLHYSEGTVLYADGSWTSPPR